MKATCSRPAEVRTFSPVPGMAAMAMRWCSSSKQRKAMRLDSKRASAPRIVFHHFTISSNLAVRRKMCANVAGRITWVGFSSTAILDLGRRCFSEIENV